MCSNPSSITQWGIAAPSVSTTTFHATLNARSSNHGRQRDRRFAVTLPLSSIPGDGVRLMAMNNVVR
jgi:hypothetical protein